MKSLKAMLQAESLVVGLTTQHVTDPWLATLWKRSGSDFVYIEYEHGFWNEADLASFVLCCRAHDLPVVSKVPECSRTAVAKLLECGVTGIQLPWTESREQIDQLVAYMKFPPIGIRAASPGTGNTDYDLSVDGRAFIEEANRETVVLAHVETKTGVRQVREILGNSQIDIVFLGMYDLTVSFGHPGSFQHPEVIAAVDDVLEATRQHGKVIGMWVPDFQAAKPWIKKGVSFFETASEVDLINASARSLIEQFAQAKTGK